MLLNFRLVSYLHFQIQNTATHAVCEELESETTLWDLDEIQTYRGNHMTLAISQTLSEPSTVLPLLPVTTETELCSLLLLPGFLSKDVQRGVSPLVPPMSLNERDQRSDDTWPAGRARSSLPPPHPCVSLPLIYPSGTWNDKAVSTYSVIPN